MSRLPASDRLRAGRPPQACSSGPPHRRGAPPRRCPAGSRVGERRHRGLDEPFSHSRMPSCTDRPRAEPASARLAAAPAGCGPRWTAPAVDRPPSPGAVGESSPSWSQLYVSCQVHSSWSRSSQAGTPRRAEISRSAGREGRARPCSTAEMNERVIGEPSSAWVSPARMRFSRMRDPRVAACWASRCAAC
jgi:hypothetical protein